MERSDATPDRLTFGKIAGLSSGIAGTLIILWFCWHVGDLITSLYALVGAALGYLTGILVVPLSKTEETKFTEISKIISGFVTGYLLSKIDPLITSLLTIDSITGSAPIARELIATRGLIALASYFIAVLIVFNMRAYWTPRDGG